LPKQKKSYKCFLASQRPLAYFKFALKTAKKTTKRPIIPLPSGKTQFVSNNNSLISTIFISEHVVPLLSQCSKKFDIRALKSRPFMSDFLLSPDGANERTLPESTKCSQM
jgi:hypothetical protein